MSNASFEPVSTNSGVQAVGHRGGRGKRVLHTVLLVLLVVACLGVPFYLLVVTAGKDQA